jgi:hypothetical protein
VAGGVLAAPSFAQVAVTIDPDVRVQTVVTQTPEVRVETQVDSAPTVRIVQEHTTKAKLEKTLRLAQQAEANALSQIAVGQVYQSLSSLYSPEMAKKTRDIALLRQMLALKLSARDIERALPLLKEMKDADKAVPSRPEQAMDEEYRALLEAKPGDPMPPSSSEALRDAASGFRSRKQAIWEKMAQQIGREKAAGIRGMLRSESGFWSTESMKGFFAAPKAGSSEFRFNLDNAPRTKSVPAAPRKPADPDAPVTAKPADGDAAPAPDVKPAEAPARAPRLRGATPDADAQDPDRGASSDAAEARRQSREARRSAARAQRGTAAPPSTNVFVAPGTRALTLDGNGGRVRLVSFYGQASLDELIDLFERKLAAMRH